jgi:tetratricopeptide (TPR) repeat protein
MGDMALRTGHLAEAERALQELTRVQKEDASVRTRQYRDFLAGSIALERGRSREAVSLLGSGISAGPSWSSVNLTDWARARAHLAAGDRDRALPLLERVVARGPYSGEPTSTFQAAILLAKEYESRGRSQEALDLYRRIAHQYRRADPGLRENEEAKAAIARIERERAQAAARR